ncbi:MULTISPECIES: hypothetical protein [Halobacteriovorax]|uniref:Uncharacterized protein n=2 Tax=Halobacteriovorax TaxID=1652133 RepID=A0ABY0IDE3_9BACT|nr:MULTISPECIES: hypothetical protein [Halobacteriovorax]RZF20554.1 hypothetical protein DAY19_11245 [Halobacteriovorax vibrionivorans]TGD47467.1 hypothetical protein EP118_07775 [Halobacteriovorax sp. Y22]
MGLMFIFPVSKEERDRITINEQGLTLKTYGLPMVFWGYLLAAATVVFAMFIGVKGPLVKLYETGDSINQALVIAVSATLILLPLITLCFYMYEKFIIKKDDKLIIKHRLFFIPILKKVHKLESSDSFSIDHFMDSPNVAKMQQDPTMRGFENKGYFQLFAKLDNGKYVFVDRSNRKADLKKIQALLCEF